MCIRQKQRHRPAFGDGFGLAKQFDGGTRMAAAPKRFGMGEKAARQLVFPIGVAQGGKRRRRAGDAIHRRWRGKWTRGQCRAGWGQPAVRLSMYAS